MRNIYQRQREIRKQYVDAVGDRLKVMDELCTCGCYRSQHGDRLDLGHGQCLLCDCLQFTWDGFLVKEGPSLGELPKASDIVLPEERTINMPEKV